MKITGLLNSWSVFSLICWIFAIASFVLAFKDPETLPRLEAGWCWLSGCLSVLAALFCAATADVLDVLDAIERRDAPETSEA